MSSGLRVEEEEEEKEEEEEGAGPGLGADRQRRAGQTHGASEVSPLNPSSVAWSLLSPKFPLSNALCSLFCSNSNFGVARRLLGCRMGSYALEDAMSAQHRNLQIIEL